MIQQEHLITIPFTETLLWSAPKMDWPMASNEGRNGSEISTKKFTETLSWSAPKMDWPMASKEGRNGSDYSALHGTAATARGNSGSGDYSNHQPHYVKQRITFLSR